MCKENLGPVVLKDNKETLEAPDHQELLVCKALKENWDLEAR